MSGDIYAVDDETLMLHNFVYDGNGKDTFFWAGSSNRPSSKGYIVPDKNGRTNVLSRFRDILLYFIDDRWYRFENEI